MALPSLSQAGTAILVLVVILEAYLYFRGRRRAIGESRREDLLHELESGRQLIDLAEVRYSEGGHEAAVRICERARMILGEARRRAAGAGERDTGELVRSELVRCDVIIDNSLRRFREDGRRRRAAPDGRLDAGRLVHIEILLDEAERLGATAEDAFAAGSFAGARDLYTKMRSKLDEARRAAAVAGSRSYVRLLDAGLERARQGMASSTAWALDGRPASGTPRAHQVKGVISPGFRREDGTFEPRPR
jgi:hypothetical protein